MPKWSLVTSLVLAESLRIQAGIAERKISEENLAQETSDPGGNCGSKKG